MTWVKVCGLTRESDVADAVDGGADAVGFVLAPGSPRAIGRTQAAALMDRIPVLRILVTVDSTARELEEAVAATGADGVQPHGRHADEAARWAQKSGLFVLRPIRRDTNGAWNDGGVPDGQIPLLDSVTGDDHGGTGRPLDWKRLVPPERRFVLAGGLTPDNLATAIETVDPWGVDASSGLESSPGMKDPARVAAFLEEAKRQ
ncbi:MAG: phosphoribosylanthranilate isomerase [Acidimicrobiia bacterium]